MMAETPAGGHRPYVLFSVIRNGVEPRLADWQANRRKHLAAAIELDTGEGWRGRRRPQTRRREPSKRRSDAKAIRTIVWRLYSANHRELAVSARPFASLESARRQVLALAREVGRLLPERVIAQGDRNSSWILPFEGEPAAMGNWYPGRRDRDRAIEASWSALGAAQVTSVVIDLASGVAGDPRGTVDDREIVLSTVLLRPLREAPAPRPIKGPTRLT